MTKLSFIKYNEKTKKKKGLIIMTTATKTKLRKMGAETKIYTPPRNNAWLFNNFHKLNFELSVQRKSGRWNHRKQSNLIWSFILGIWIPPINVIKSQKEGYMWDVLDGIQRLHTVNQFKNGEFELLDFEFIANNENDVIEDVEDNDIEDVIENVYIEDLVGKKFDELPSEVQNEIKMGCFQFVEFKNTNEDQIEWQFILINDNEPFSIMELIRARAGEEIRGYLDAVVEFPFWAKINFSKSDVHTYQDQIVILQIMSLLEDKSMNFDKKNFTKFVAYLRKNGIKETIKEEVEKVFNYLDEAFVVDMDKQVYVKDLDLLRKIHIPNIFMTAKEAIEENIEPLDFGNFVINFLRKQLNNRKEHKQDELIALTKYNQATEKSTNKEESIQTRVEEMMVEFYRFLEDRKENKDQLLVVAGNVS